MRGIEIESGLTLRFPGRDANFSEGVEIGMLATLMATGADGCTRWIAAGNVEQARAVAEAMGYFLIEGLGTNEVIEVHLSRKGARPLLRAIAGGRVDPD